MPPGRFALPQGFVIRARDNTLEGLPNPPVAVRAPDRQSLWPCRPTTFSWLLNEEPEPNSSPLALAQQSKVTALLNAAPAARVAALLKTVESCGESHNVNGLCVLGLKAIGNDPALPVVTHSFLLRVVHLLCLQRSTTTTRASTIVSILCDFFEVVMELQAALGIAEGAKELSSPAANEPVVEPGEDEVGKLSPRLLIKVSRINATENSHQDTPKNPLTAPALPATAVTTTSEVNLSGGTPQTVSVSANPLVTLDKQRLKKVNHSMKTLKKRKLLDPSALQKVNPLLGAMVRALLESSKDQKLKEEHLLQLNDILTCKDDILRMQIVFSVFSCNGKIITLKGLTQAIRALVGSFPAEFISVLFTLINECQTEEQFAQCQRFANATQQNPPPTDYDLFDVPVLAVGNLITVDAAIAFCHALDNQAVREYMSLFVALFQERPEVDTPPVRQRVWKILREFSIFLCISLPALPSVVMWLGLALVLPEIMEHFSVTAIEASLPLSALPVIDAICLPLLGSPMLKYLGPRITAAVCNFFILIPCFIMLIATNNTNWPLFMIGFMSTGIISHISPSATYQDMSTTFSGQSSLLALPGFEIFRSVVYIVMSYAPSLALSGGRGLAGVIWMLIILACFTIVANPFALWVLSNLRKKKMSEEADNANGRTTKDWTQVLRNSVPLPFGVMPVETHAEEVETDKNAKIPARIWPAVLMGLGYAIMFNMAYSYVVYSLVESDSTVTIPQASSVTLGPFSAIGFWANAILFPLVLKYGKRADLYVIGCIAFNVPFFWLAFGPYKQLALSIVTPIVFSIGGLGLTTLELCHSTACTYGVPRSKMWMIVPLFNGVYPAGGIIAAQVWPRIASAASIQTAWQVTCGIFGTYMILMCLLTKILDDGSLNSRGAKLTVQQQRLKRDWLLIRLNKALQWKPLRVQPANQQQPLVAEDTSNIPGPSCSPMSNTEHVAGGPDNAKPIVLDVAVDVETDPEPLNLEDVNEDDQV